MADSPEKGTDGALTLTITTDGSELDDTVGVVSVIVNKAINRIPYARLVVQDGDMPEQDFPVSNMTEFQPGAEISISAGYGETLDVIFKGVVVKHGIRIGRNNRSHLVVECRDKAVAMTLGRKNANYVDSKDSDIISKVLGNYGGLSSEVEATTYQWKEIVQYYSTDWDFVVSRAEANGQLVIVDDGTVSVKAPDTSTDAVLAVTYGIDVMELDADVDARSQLSAVKAVSWDPKTQAVVSGKDAAPLTLNEQGNLTSATLAQVLGLDSFRLQTVAPLEKPVLDTWSDAQQLKAGLARIQGRMTFQGNSKAKVGTTVELGGVGERFNGKVFVTVVEHEISAGNWVSSVRLGAASQWLADKRDVAPPPASGLVPGVEGLQVGVVKKLDEDPDGMSRIQVSVPLLESETEGVWARLANFYGTNGAGAFFIPEIGDEVVLGYFNNDPSNPVILGSLYSSKNKAPYALAANNFTKALVTKANLKLELDDENKIISLVTPGNNTIVISDKDKSVVLTDQNGNTVELGQSGIKLDSSKDISIAAKGKIDIAATGALSIKSNADVSIDGMNVNANAQVGLTAKGNATAEISASGQTTVKGAMVMIN